MTQLYSFCQVQLTTSTTWDRSTWKTLVDVSFIAVILVARAKEAATHLFVNMFPRHQRRMLTSILRKNANRVHSVLAPTAHDGKRSAHSIGSLQNAWTREGVENESRPTPQAQQLYALTTKLLMRYCALCKRTLPISGDCLAPPKPRTMPRPHPLRTRNITFSSHSNSIIQVAISLKYLLGRWISHMICNLLAQIHAV